jgi:glycosyltransferase involved in cell wall biosynthesis
LSVGRLAPNKAVEDTLEALLCFRQTYDPGASLRVIGRPSLTLYAQALHRFSAELGLADAVTFEERLSDEALADAYQEADVLVVLSAHEGFCLPVVEAMAQGLAVVAWARGALPEVLGDGGLLIEDKSPASVAGAVQRLRTDPRLADQLSQSAARRVADLGIESSGPRLVRLLSALHDGTVLPDDVGLEPPGGTTRSGL